VPCALPQRWYWTLPSVLPRYLPWFTRNDITSFGSGVPLTGDSLSIYQTPVHGTVVILNGSTIIYTPYPGFVGTDFYSYTVCNSCGNCAQASVSIEVKPFCPPPSPAADHYTVYNNVSSTLAVTANDSNIVGGPTTVTVMQCAYSWQRHSVGEYGGL
jgi:hypothetical protein